MAVVLDNYIEVRLLEHAATATYLLNKNQIVNAQTVAYKGKYAIQLTVLPGYSFLVHPSGSVTGLYDDLATAKAGRDALLREQYETPAP